eukprot:15459786-Alexandrium_andersonii.AAC.1
MGDNVSCSFLRILGGLPPPGVPAAPRSGYRPPGSTINRFRHAPEALFRVARGAVGPPGGCGGSGGRQPFGAGTQEAEP